MNIAFSWNNHAAKAATVITASAVVPELPVQRLKDPAITRRTRSPLGVTTVTYDFDFGAAVELGLLAFAQPWDAGGKFDDDQAAVGILAPGDKVRHRLANDAAFGTPIYDSGSIDCLVDPFNRLHLHVPSSPLVARYYRLEIVASSLISTAQFVDLGYVWAGPLWQPVRNLEYGYAPTIAPLSQPTETPTGTRYTDILPNRRAFSCSLPSLTEAEAMDNITSMLGHAGTHRPVMVLPDPASVYANIQSILGTIENVQGPARTSLPQYACSFTIKQAM